MRRSITVVVMCSIPLGMYVWPGLMIRIFVFVAIVNLARTSIFKVDIIIVVATPRPGETVALLEKTHL